nr:disulfide bond formation protein B [Altericroceibacterium xinjiangense]
MAPSTRLAQRLALGVPALLLAGAYISQYGFGLYPCEMCWWQRYPHFAAIALGLISTVAAPKRVWIALAGLAILISGLIGAYHAGVEYGWWEGITTCSSLTGAGNALDAIMEAPLVRCDQVQWSVAAISLAGWNFLFSSVTAAAIFWLLARKDRV